VCQDRRAKSARVLHKPLYFTMNKLIKCLNSLSPFIATSAALASALLAYFAYDYSQHINKASLSLLDVPIQQERKKPDTLNVRFLFNFQNIGNEPLHVDNITTAYFNFKTKKFTTIYKNHRIINVISPNAIFNQPASIIFQDINDKLTNEGIISSLPDWVGNIAIIMIVEFSAKDSTYLLKHYIGWKGGSKTHQISQKEYNEMEPFLHDNFKL